MKKTLYRSRKNNVIAGVFGGIGEYFDTDPVLVRLLYLFISIFTGILPGIIGYLIALAIVPMEPLITTSTPVHEEKNDDTKV